MESAVHTCSDQGVAGSSRNSTLVVFVPAHPDVALVTPTYTPAAGRHSSQFAFFGTTSVLTRLLCAALSPHKKKKVQQAQA